MDKLTLRKQCRKLTVAVITAILLFGCNSDDRIQTSNIDHCSDVEQAPNISLSKTIAPFANKMQESTGVYVLEQGTEAMFTRAWLSENAEQTIDVQYFIFSTDNIGLLAIDYMVRAAERGVKVRILVDDIMIDASGDELLKLAAHENISIKIYNPLANVGKNMAQKLFNLTTKFHDFNQRMHNKAFTVDGKISITGGRNVADEYFGYDHAFNFRDRDVLLLGGITQQIQASFEQYWQHDLSVPVEQLVSTKTKPTTNYDVLHQYACDPVNFNPKVRKAIHDLPKTFQLVEQAGQLHWLDNVEYISDLPGKNSGEHFLGGGGLSTQKLIELVTNAKHSVTIQTPYLVTTDLAKNLLKSLVERGVTVKILTNSLASNDNLEAFSGYQRDRKALLTTGAEIYEFKPDAKIRQKVMSEVMEGQLSNMPIFGLHAKSMVIDNAITVIGTFNVDPRSANLNTESFVILKSQEIARSVEQGMNIEMQAENAWRITPDWNPDGEVSRFKQLGVKLRKIVPKNIL